MKLSEFFGQILSMFESHTAAAAHINDTVAATSMGPLVNAMKQNNEALRKMVADAKAEEEPETVDEATTEWDEDVVEIPPGHDAELDALRAVADEQGVKYNMRTKAPGLRKALGMSADESVTVDPKHLSDDMQAQIKEETADHSADDLNAEEAAKHAQG